MADSGIAAVMGARLAWWADGDGPAVVLVHAGVADARMWDGVLGALTGSHRVVRYDMRGFGETRSPPGPFVPSRDLGGLLDALGIARAHVVGASYGGCVALELAATEPDRVASLVLLAPGLPDIDPSPQLVAYAQAEDAAIALGRIEDAIEINVRMWAGDSTLGVRELVARMQRLAFERQLREGADPEQLEPPVSTRLGAIGVPATIAIGDRDAADFELIAQRLLAGLPHATLHVVRDAGHLLALDQPAAVGQLIAGHLDGLTPRASPAP